MNSLFFLVFLISCASAVAGFEYTQKEIEESESNLEKWKHFATDLDGVPDQTDFEKLCLGLRATADPSVFPFGDRLGAHDAIKRALLGSTGYGQFWVSLLEEAWHQVLVAENISKRGPALAKFNNVQVSMLKTLSELPSSETVSALGDLIFDDNDFGPVPNEGGQSRDHAEQRVQPTSLYAVMAFANLPIDSPPVPDRKLKAVVYEEDLAAWCLWYEQVKLGKRTFRFKGDPREYNLDGPPPEVTLATRPRMSGLQETEQGASGAEEGRRLPWLAVGGALALLGLAGFACLRSRRGNGGAAG